MVLGFLVGNSRVRYGFFEGSKVCESGAVAWGDLQREVPAVAATALRRGVAVAVLGSVRDDLLPGLERQLPGTLLPLRRARRDFPIPIASRYERPEEAGTDRLLASVAARERARGSGALVVDFGTAVSISVVSPAGEFLGGLIAPGLAATRAGLHASAPRLPVADLPVPELPAPRPAVPKGERHSNPVARSAEAAVDLGTRLFVAGGTRTMVLEILGALPFRPLVLATGGEACLFSQAIPEVAEVVPDLVLEGLAISFHAARRPQDGR
jgi:type III pantothenate kinase